MFALKCQKELIQMMKKLSSKKKEEVMKNIIYLYELHNLMNFMPKNVIIYYKIARLRHELINN